MVEFQSLIPSPFWPCEMRGAGVGVTLAARPWFEAENMGV